MRPKTTFLICGFVCCFGMAPTNSQSPKKTKTSKAAPTISAEIKAAAHAAATSGCDTSLWKHVYRPARLVVVEKCITVTGTIDHIKREADGDDHIQVKVDPHSTSCSTTAIFKFRPGRSW